MGLNDLSPELLLGISAFLGQVDLLNISLTSRYLRNATQPELFREYKNIRSLRTSFRLFVKRLIKQPELRKYVRKLYIRSWETLDSYNPRWHEPISRPHESDEEDTEMVLRNKIDSFDSARERKHNEPSEAEYVMFTEAARDAGVIANIFPYEQESYLIKVVRPMLFHEIDPAECWYTPAFDKHVPFSEIPYDRKFCQMLRTGIEDPFLVLLVALLPNVREITLLGIPSDINALQWRANHEFSALRRLTASAIDADSIWPIAWAAPVLQKANLLRFEASGTSSWYEDLDRPEDDFDNVRLVELQLDIATRLGFLDLQWCSLTTKDLRCLLRACRNLRTFMYSSADEGRDICSPSPAKMIELLYPLKDSLQVLSLDMSIDYYEDWDPTRDDRIESLAHMTGLQVIDTTPEMWRMVEEIEFEEVLLEEEEDPENEEFDSQEGLIAIPPDDSTSPTVREKQRLCLRLPPNAHTVMFHLSNNNAMTSITQLRDLLRVHAQVLPKLKYLSVGVDEEYGDEEYIKELKTLWEHYGHWAADGIAPLHLAHITYPGLRSVLHEVLKVRKLPRIIWVRGRYALRKTKPDIVVRTLSALRKKYEEMGVKDDEEIRQKMAADPEMSKMKEYTGYEMVTEYESSDAEDFEWWDGESQAEDS